MVRAFSPLPFGRVFSPPSGVSHPPLDTHSLAMEQEVVNSLQNRCRTKEEEAEISFSAHSKVDLLEECSLSLFGKLFSDRQQNHRAQKSTLRAAWKMGLELRIIEVGNNIFQ